jgi:hypothetical protein
LSPLAITSLSFLSVRIRVRVKVRAREEENVWTRAWLSWLGRRLVTPKIAGSNPVVLEKKLLKNKRGVETRFKGFSKQVDVYSTQRFVCAMA